LPLADCKGRAFTALCQEPPIIGQRSFPFLSPLAIVRLRRKITQNCVLLNLGIDMRGVAPASREGIIPLCLVRFALWAIAWQSQESATCRLLNLGIDMRGFAPAPHEKLSFSTSKCFLAYITHFFRPTRSGAGSYPPLEKGLHRSIRHEPSKIPNTTPLLLMLSKVYCEQVGR